MRSIITKVKQFYELYIFYNIGLYRWKFSGNGGQVFIKIFQKYFL